MVCYLQWVRLETPKYESLVIQHLSKSEATFHQMCVQFTQVLQQSFLCLWTVLKVFGVGQCVSLQLNVSRCYPIVCYSFCHQTQHPISFRSWVTVRFLGGFCLSDFLAEATNVQFMSGSGALGVADCFCCFF